MHHYLMSADFVALHTCCSMSCLSNDTVGRVHRELVLVNLVVDRRSLDFAALGGNVLEVGVVDGVHCWITD